MAPARREDRTRRSRDRRSQQNSRALHAVEQDDNRREFADYGREQADEQGVPAGATIALEASSLCCLRMGSRARRAIVIAYGAPGGPVGRQRRNPPLDSIASQNARGHLQLVVSAL